MSNTFGVVALGRPTFDVPFAEETLGRAFATLARAGINTVGPRTLLFDADAARAALADIEAAGPIDALLLIQVTFTDATMTVDVARNAAVPVGIWALPEPRLGGRLRLNAFCGLNLAAHALGRVGLAHHWLFADPDAPEVPAALATFSAPVSRTASRARQLPRRDDTAALASIRGATISVVGQHPAGFDTCSYDADRLKALADIRVRTVGLTELFDRAKAVATPRVADVRSGVSGALAGLDAVNQTELDRSLRVFCALDDVATETKARGLAVRCWPETFTEYGCAACGPMAMMNERRVPTACEADVYGSLSALMLQEMAGEPSWMADLVAVDLADDTGVFWHCGLAPLSMCDPEAQPEATIHSNRKMPLLHQFPLKPGVFTFARISQAGGNEKLVLGTGEFLRRPMAFTGTSGVFRLHRPLRDVLDTIMDEGLEHHYAIAYGDHRAALIETGAALGLPVLEVA